MAIKFDKIKELDPHQKKVVEEFVTGYIREHDKPPLLRDVTKNLNPEADGRSYLGKAIQNYLDEIGIQYKTTEYENKALELTPEQTEYVLENMSVMKPIEMARHLFGNDIASQFDARAMPVVSLVQSIQSQNIINPPKEGEYVPPTTLRDTLAKVNRVFNDTIYKEKDLSHKDKRCLAALRMRLNSPRFARTWKNYLIEEAREAFEAGFIRSTHDKEDLTEAELNLTIDLVTDQTDLNTVRKQRNILDRKLEEIDDDKDAKISISLVEAIGALGKREDETRKRIRTISDALDGTRKDRLKNQKSGTATFDSVLAAWREEETRTKFYKIADKNKELLGEEVERLEGMDELRVKILGIDAEELEDG